MTDKQLTWVGSARADLASLPESARRQLGFDLREVQRGRSARDWKPMSTVGAGVIEIRVRSDDGAFRVFYIATFPDAIYVLHAFQKKTQKTSALDLELARSRYAAVRRQRKEK
jgi:phage-related protein